MPATFSPIELEIVRDGATARVEVPVSRLYSGRDAGYSDRNFPGVVFHDDPSEVDFDDARVIEADDAFPFAVGATFALNDAEREEATEFVFAAI